MDRSWMQLNRSNPSFAEGVEEFINFAYSKKEPMRKFLVLVMHATTSVIKLKKLLGNIENNIDINELDDDCNVDEMLDMLNDFSNAYLRENLGFKYEKIHSCPNDCVLFWKEYENFENCPKCGTCKWKYEGSKKIPRKVLRYFPLKPRLQRLFVNKDLAENMRWHKEKLVHENDVMRHPADSELWRDFDKKYPLFADDPRSVRIGLASDGFNPFGNMSTSYSIWPVLLVPYNLPPWMCMKDPFLLLSMLIPGPKGPGNDIDVYLQPLIDELKELWEVGIEAYDAYKKENFILRAALMWTISDLPAYSYCLGGSHLATLLVPFA
ncbi:UNVERIFIED_CONTAM: hypothetical protein Scaly_2814100 [Sesamum calycinum]|uniref:Transposase n=1 Tax=Sesamum calycinum TaxID=2727403 RepID=A0AAW2IU22_9LAMI